MQNMIDKKVQKRGGGMPGYPECKIGFRKESKARLSGLKYPSVSL